MGSGKIKPPKTRIAKIDSNMKVSIPISIPIDLLAKVITAAEEFLGKPIESKSEAFQIVLKQGIARILEIQDRKLHMGKIDQEKKDQENIQR
ncbi:MAG: hypothetical protein DRJ03_24435 [Chloroflexi bacterium]|nr:MAG: hypothetical protein DRJ03_24435 [Chloroflexota bacterium]